MNTSTKVSLAILISLGVVGVGGYYLADKNMKEKEIQLQNVMAKIQTLLPIGAKQENNINRGLFSSSGIYKIIYLDQAGSETFSVNYKLKHGVPFLFTGKVDVEATGNLTGPITQYVKVTGDFLKTKGAILKDGSFDFVSDSSPIVIQSGNTIYKQQATVPSSKSFLSYNSQTGLVKSSLNIDSMQNILLTAKGKADFQIKNIKIVRDFHINDVNMGEFSLSIFELKNQLLALKNIDIKNGIYKENQKYRMTNSVKVGEIQFVILGQEKMQLDAQYSINNLNVEAVDHMIEKYKNAEKSKEVDAESIRINMLKIIQSGFNFNIDKFSFKNKKGSISIAGKAEIKAVPELSAVSMAEQTGLLLSITTEGNMTGAALKSYQQMALLPLGDYSSSANKKVSMVTNYSKGVVLANNVIIENTPLRAVIASFLEGIDAKLGVYTPPIVPVSPTVITIQ